MTPTIVLSAFQQKDVWESWISSEMRAYYFADLSQRFALEQKICNWLSLMFSSGAFVSVVTGLGDWAVASLTLLAAALSAFTLVQQNQKRVTDCLDLHFRWNRLSGEYRSLWNDMYSDEARTKFVMLEEKMAELSKSSATFPRDKERMLKWQNYVEMHLGKTVSA